MPNRGGGVRGGFGKRPDFFRIFICAPFPKKFCGPGILKKYSWKKVIGIQTIFWTLENESDKIHKYINFPPGKLFRIIELKTTHLVGHHRHHDRRHPQHVQCDREQLEEAAGGFGQPAG